MLLFQASTSTQASPTPAAVLSQVPAEFSYIVVIYWSFCDHDFSHDRHQRKEEVTFEAGELEGKQKAVVVEVLLEEDLSLEQSSKITMSLRKVIFGL